MRATHVDAVAYNGWMSKRGWILFISLGLLWGMPYLLIRIAVVELDPLIVAVGRTFIGALLLLPLALHRNALAPAFRKWKWLLAFTLIEISIPWVLLGHAETSARLPAGVELAYDGLVLDVEVEAS